MMKKITAVAALLFLSVVAFSQDATSVADSLFETNILNEMEVVASRYDKRTPFTATTLDKKVLT